MKSFLLKGKKPIISWGMLPDNIFYEGAIPKKYNLAVCPSYGTVVIDVDRHGKIDGFDNIPRNLYKELLKTYSYPTKNDGRHYWIKYTGTKLLKNKASNLGIDLRIGAKGTNNGGYVVYYPAENGEDIRHKIKLINPSSKELNSWLEKLFI